MFIIENRGKKGKTVEIYSFPSLSIKLNAPLKYIFHSKFVIRCFSVGYLDFVCAVKSTHVDCLH